VKAAMRFVFVSSAAEALEALFPKGSIVPLRAPGAAAKGRRKPAARSAAAKPARKAPGKKG
jgi:hypothetical protein